MNKKELVAQISQECSLKKKDVSVILDTTLAKISDTLLSGDKVMISGFGTFNVKDRNSKICYNPRTNKRTRIAPSKAVVFKSARIMRDRFNVNGEHFPSKKSAV